MASRDTAGAGRRLHIVINDAGHVVRGVERIIGRRRPHVSSTTGPIGHRRVRVKETYGMHSSRVSGLGARICCAGLSRSHGRTGKCRRAAVGWTGCIMFDPEALFSPAGGSCSCLCGGPRSIHCRRNRTVGGDLCVGRKCRRSRGSCAGAYACIPAVSSRACIWLPQQTHGWVGECLCCHRMSR